MGDSLLLHRVCGLFKLYSKAEKKKRIFKKKSNMLKCLKSQSVVSNVACINLRNGGGLELMFSGTQERLSAA